MVVLNRIYTRTGDGGQTSLGDGARVAKHALRVETYGCVDELNSTLGVSRLHAAAGSELAAAMARIQNDLFDLGADYCRPVAAGGSSEDGGASALRVVEAQTDRLEREIDAMNAGLAPLKSFVLPGGGPLAAHLHVARTVCRRAERAATALAVEEEINPLANRYLNRLSDWLFVAARAANAGAEGTGDVLWVPGDNR